MPESATFAARAHLAACLLLLLLCTAASSESYNDAELREYLRNERLSRDLAASSESGRGCLYEGRWHADGGAVTSRAACLKCACVGGALTCSRRACAPLPDPAPRHCHVLHRRGACCPELHCPNGVVMMEHGASSRFENEDHPDVTSAVSLAHACVEGGTVYSAGSAMESSVACEQCFCLHGARRCVRPRCLPPPLGCQARPAPGACCPQRYYCDHEVSTKPPEHRPHDCQIEGTWIEEGERVTRAEAQVHCTQCFCLRGSARCQPLACAPPLLGCKPLLRPGQCCAHQYQCDHKQRQGVVSVSKGVVTTNLLHNALTSLNHEDRSFHSPTTSYQETTTSQEIKDDITTDGVANLTTTTTSASQQLEEEDVFTTAGSSSSKEDISTNKVKRKTSDSVSTSTSHKPASTSTSTKASQKPTSTITTTTITSTTEKLNITTDENIPTVETATDTERASTEQPEESVKIMINGTINCTTEFTSKSVPVNLETDDTESIKTDSIRDSPNVERMDVESNTFNPNDIITDRNINGDFDENETFTINVTSSLRTNTSHSTTGPSVAVVSKPSVVTDFKHAINATKNTDEDYDYDYAKPTLPPSLPNLKIIPFLAADAVVDDDEEIIEKDILTYPILEREDKFPVYYPKLEKETSYATRREDVYHPTKYPIFTSEQVDPQYPSLTHDVDLPSSSGRHENLLAPAHTVAAILGDAASGPSKPATKLPTTNFDVKEPSENLFSPPVETEGGFIPKGPGIIDEYFAVYPSTPPGPHIADLTTSMQLDTDKEDCISSDGHRIAEGETVSLACSVCTCLWGEIHCSPRTCLTPPMCRRTPASTSSGDLCCGHLVCDQANRTTLVSTTTTTEIPVTTFVEKEDNNVTQSEIFHTEASALADDNIAYNNTIIKMVENNILQSETKDKNKLFNSTETKDEKPSTVLSKVTEKESVSAQSVSTTGSPVITLKTTTSTTTQEPVKLDHQNTHSQEYEEEEEEDEGFSFGSVLKLLLSENYEATTNPPFKKKSTVPATTESTTRPAPTTSKLILTKIPPTKPFSALTPYRPMYPPHKNIFAPTSVNRIDHLVLGEATAIKRTTMRPATTIKPVVTSFKTVTSTRYVPSRTPFITLSPPEETTKDETKVPGSVNTMLNELPRPTAGPALGALGVGPGLLKLAGCNIYGRMYRVGRIIAELSTPCQECRCTELGVQCAPLPC